MTDEQMTRGNKLNNEMFETRQALDLAKKRITVHGVYDGGGTTSLYLKGEVLTIIQTLVVAHFEKKLADMVAEYEAL